MLTVGVEKDHYRGVAWLAHKVNEGAGMLGLSAGKLVGEGADEEELLIQPIEPKHLFQDETLELSPHRGLNINR